MSEQFSDGQPIYFTKKTGRGDAPTYIGYIKWTVPPTHRHPVRYYISYSTPKGTREANVYPWELEARAQQPASDGGERHRGA